MRILFGFLFLAQVAFGAGTGADALLDSLGGAPAKTTTGTTINAAPTTGLASADLSDPFLVQFFAQVQVAQDMPFEARLWAQKVLKKDFQGAAHLWTAIQKHLPGRFESAARAAFLYSLWRLKLPQTFFNEWVDSLTRKSFLDSPLSLALDQTIDPDFNKWLLSNAITITPEQQKILQGIDLARGGHYASLRAWAALRTGEAAAQTLSILPVDHPLTIPLANTVSLALAKKGDLRGAGGVLKQHLEPAIETRKDVKALSKHLMQVARLLYQAGSLDGAAQFYQRIPDNADDFLKAREELAWVWLRQGKTPELRGELKTLRSGLFKEKFNPDVYVVRAISHLKLCFYSEAEKELNEFVNVNKQWASRIEAALKAEDPIQDETDFFVDAAKRAMASRKAEADLLDALATESITATLPAVGPQQHWERARTKALVALERAKKSSADEVRRIWKNRKTVLTEAIRKMQFVKVELFSQVRTLTRAQTPAGTPSADIAAIQKDTRDRIHGDAAAAMKVASQGELVFPFDGVIWPDELFKLTSVAESVCQQKAKK